MLVQLSERLMLFGRKNYFVRNYSKTTSQRNSQSCSWCYRKCRLAILRCVKEAVIDLKTIGYEVVGLNKPLIL
jgi:hypothetical protein